MENDLESRGSQGKKTITVETYKKLTTNPEKVVQREVGKLGDRVDIAKDMEGGGGQRQYGVRLIEGVKEKEGTRGIKVDESKVSLERKN